MEVNFRQVNWKNNWVKFIKLQVIEINMWKEKVQKYEDSVQVDSIL